MQPRRPRQTPAQQTHGQPMLCPSDHKVHERERRLRRCALILVCHHNHEHPDGKTLQQPCREGQPVQPFPLAGIHPRQYGSYDADAPGDRLGQMLPRHKSAALPRNGLKRHWRHATCPAQQVLIPAHRAGFYWQPFERCLGSNRARGHPLNRHQTWHFEAQARTKMTGNQWVAVPLVASATLQSADQNRAQMPTSPTPVFRRSRHRDHRETRLCANLNW